MRAEVQFGCGFAIGVERMCSRRLVLVYGADRRRQLGGVSKANGRSETVVLRKEGGQVNSPQKCGGVCDFREVALRFVETGGARTVILVEIFATKEWEILGEVFAVATSPISICSRNGGDPPKYCCQ